MNAILINIILRKLQTLRSQYKKRKGFLIKKSCKSGTGQEDVYEPKPWCFDSLHFLDDAVTPRDDGGYPSSSTADGGDEATHRPNAEPHSR